jgi:hypothetical protein
MAKDLKEDSRSIFQVLHQHGGELRRFPVFRLGFKPSTLEYKSGLLLLYEVAP